MEEHDGRQFVGIDLHRQRSVIVRQTNAGEQLSAVRIVNDPVALGLQLESFDNRLRKECLNRNHWNSLLEARVVIGDFKHEHNHRHGHSALGYLTPAEYAAGCRHTHHPVACEIN
jgi:transposase InsO family protein